MSADPCISAAVVGATGYTGGELCRLLLNHPSLRAILPTSRESDDFERIHRNLLGSGLRFCAVDRVRELVDDLDVVFFCTPSGEAMRLAPYFLDRGVRVIDISADFRFGDPDLYKAVYGQAHTAPQLLPEAVYGATEFERAAVSSARLIANPGCYVMTALLALVPLARARYLRPDRAVHVTAINGTTGAGATPNRDILHAEVFGSMLPYNLDGHRHAPEIEYHLERISGRRFPVAFSAAHGSFARGIYLQVSVEVADSLAEHISRSMLLDLYLNTYGAGHEGEFFVLVNDSERRGTLNVKEYDLYPSLAGVIGSNFCHLGIDYDERSRMIKVVAVTDNLVKGAAGSAIQNMNVALGLDETLGLRHYGL